MVTKQAKEGLKPQSFLIHLLYLNTNFQNPNVTKTLRSIPFLTHDNPTTNKSSRTHNSKSQFPLICTFELITHLAVV